MYSLEVITGQTATGKTSCALVRAQQTNADIISADSRQLYQHLTCITGKDIDSASFTLIEDLPQFRIGYYTVDGIRIWGYDLVMPDQPVSSALYVTYVNYILENTIHTHATPIVVGGTYLYLQDLLYGIASPVQPNAKVRSELASCTVPELQELLKKHAPDVYAQLNHSDQHNPHRLIRRIEIAVSGSELHLPSSEPKYTITSFIGLRHATPELLEQRIHARVIDRFEHGALAEIKHLISLGYTAESPGCTATGYAEMFAYHAGELGREDAINQWAQSEIRYAKRQWTFMKKNPAIQWELV